MTSLTSDSASAPAPSDLRPGPSHGDPEIPGNLTKPSPRPRGWRWWLPRGLLAAIFLFAVTVTWLAITAPLSKSLQPISPPEITLLAADGTPIARSGAVVEQPVQVAKLPKHVIHAFIAIEDRRFYTHWGIDPRGLARAAWGNLTSDRTQGGSTITQQLAKLSFLTAERSLGRKAREMLIAFWLEAWLSKDEILKRYLSNAYYGDNTYGLRAASLHYFHRQPEKLTLGEAAMLAGLMQAPSRYAPTKHLKLAQARMHTVLQAMVDASYLTQDEAKNVRTPRLDVRARSQLPTGTYFADWALPQVRGQGDSGYARMTYATTLDARLQAAARHATARAGLAGAQVALVAMRRNGEVVAMVGGNDYAASPFNRATQSRRQPGSTFKLFVYLAALRDGWRPEDTIDNSEITTGAYRPRNAGGGYSKSITLEDAFARSSNVAAVRLFNEVGDKAVIATARDLGVTSPLPRNDPSLPLGTSSMTLLELTAAYAGVAANSFPVVPTAFKAKEQGWLDWLVNGPHSLSSREHRDMERLLGRTVRQGTGRGARLSQASFGKTGTSQDSRDALFIGYSGDLVVGVWIGNDDNSPLKGVSGGGLPARIWRDFMRDALHERPAPRKPRPSDPVQPLDLPDLGNIPLGDAGHLRIENGQAVVTTDVGGAPVDIRVNNDGIKVDNAAINEQIDRARELLNGPREQTRNASQPPARRAAPDDAAPRVP